jgi:UDP-4-amino-4,6-dideoxy-N-acetyl-beta-L-altrosamine transaminase
MSRISIQYGKQNITNEDIAEVIAALQSDYLTQGPRIKQFEETFANYVGSKYAVAVSNGTAALHLCALALGVKAGDKVITSPITFAASANCIRFCDGEVVFADIDPTTYLIDYDSVKRILEASPIGTYKGIIPVDFAGRAVDLEKFRELAKQYNLWIIEDACHAPGGYFINSVGKPQLCGNGNYADVAIFSFHPVKHIACGEGGMVTTNDEEIYKNILSLRSHGISKNETDFVNSVSFACAQESEIGHYPDWYMEMQILGYNYRLTDFQAALGLSQLRRAEEGLKKRRLLASNYYKAFTGLKFIKSQSGVVEGHAYHLYIIEVESRLELFNYLRKNKVNAQVHYIPCHLMPYYRQLGWKEGDFPHSESYYKGCISLPMYPTLSINDQNYIIQLIQEFYRCQHMDY